MADINDLKTLNEINAQLLKSNELTVEQKELLEQRKNIVEQIIKLQEQDAASAKARAAEIDLLLKYEKDINEQKKLRLQKTEAEFEAAKQELRLLQTKGELGTAEYDLKLKTFEAAKAAYDQEKKSLEIVEKKAEIWKKIYDFLSNEVEESYSRIVGFAKSFFTEAMNTQLMLAKFGKPELLNSQNYDAANQAFRDFGMGMKEVSEAAIALDSNFSQFQNQSAQTQQDLTLMAGKLNNLGISLEETGKNFNKFSRGFGMSVEGSKRALESIALTATKAGISPQKAFADLSANIDRLSGSGAKSTKIFEELMKKSKELGVEVGSMLDIVGTSFDTFEGAADKAGKLNAILGGDFLNSVEMLNATEEQRVELLRQSFQQSGKNFDELDRFTKKSIIATMGFKNEAEARMMLGRVSTEERLRMKSDQEAQDQLQKAQLNSVDSMRKMQMAFYDMMPAIKSIAESVRDFVNWLNSGTFGAKAFIYTLILVTAAFKGLQVVMGIITGIKAIAAAFGKTGKSAAEAGKGLEAAGQGAEKGSKPMAAALENVGKAAAANSSGLAILAVTIISIGASMAIAALGLAVLVRSFSGLGDAAGPAAVAVIGFTIAFGAMVVGIVALAPALAPVLPILGSLGLVLLAIGGAIAIAAVGVGFMVEKIGNLVKSANSETIQAFISLAGAIAGIGLAIASIAINPFSFIGLMALAKMIDSIKESINSIEINDSLKAKVEVIKTVGEVIRISSSIKEGDMKPAKDFIAAAENYYKAQKDSKTQDQDALVQALKQIMKPEGGTKSTSDNTKPQEIILKVDGKSLRAVIMGVPAAVHSPSQ